MPDSMSTLGVTRRCKPVGPMPEVPDDFDVLNQGAQQAAPLPSQPKLQTDISAANAIALIKAAQNALSNDKARSRQAASYKRSVGPSFDKQILSLVQTFFAVRPHFPPRKHRVSSPSLLLQGMAPPQLANTLHRYMADAGVNGDDKAARIISRVFSAMVLEALFR